MSRIALVLLLFSLTGCAPTVNIYGVFVDPWIVCGLFGVGFSYGIFNILGRKSATVELSESNLLFLCLALLLTLIIWWTFFHYF